VFDVTSTNINHDNSTRKYQMPPIAMQSQKITAGSLKSPAKPSLQDFKRHMNTNNISHHKLGERNQDSKHQACQRSGISNPQKFKPPWN